MSLRLGIVISMQCLQHFLVASAGLECLHGPSSFGEQRFGRNRASDRMDDSAVWSAEIAGEVAAIFLKLSIHVNNFKRSDLLMSRDKVIREILGNFAIRQSDRSELLGVVSGEPGVFEITGDMDQEHQFVFRASLLRSLGR